MSEVLPFPQDAALSATEHGALAQYEQTIAEGLRTFVTVGQALVAIRDGRLYRKTHATFEAYCQERWGMVRRQANRLISAAEVVTNLGPIGPILPLTESQSRPLKRHSRPAALSPDACHL